MKMPINQALFTIWYVKPQKISSFLTMFVWNSRAAYQFLYATLWHISISAGVVVSVAFQQVDGSPDAEACAKGNNQSLKNADSRVEKFHICVAGIIGCWLCWDLADTAGAGAKAAMQPRFRLLLSNFSSWIRSDPASEEASFLIRIYMKSRRMRAAGLCAQTRPASNTS